MTNDSKMIHIRIPKKLWVYYKKQTIKAETTMNNIILSILETHKEKSKENVDLY